MPEPACCIVGGGPAGVMLGFLLARSGVRVTVLEKHADFFRDFRGDTIHPSTLELMHELGLLDKFLALPHNEVTTVGGRIGDVEIPVADFSRIPAHCKFVAFMPQWDFLNFLSEQGRRYAGFDLRMETEATDLIEESGRIAGVRAKTPQGEIEIRAPLTIGADGRTSVVRERAGLCVHDFGAPMDLLWMRISRQYGDPNSVLGIIREGHALVMLDRGDYWQCAWLIEKGGIETVKAHGLEQLREQIATVAPFLRERLAQLDDWNKIATLTVRVDRLEQWCRPGLLCIGDAAHAMSPIGGVGVNLAIQDAVAAANQLAQPLLSGSVQLADLQAVQRRREFPTRVTQGLQLFIQKHAIEPILRTGITPSNALPVRLLRGFPLLRRIPALLIGIGVRPEHIRTPSTSSGMVRQAHHDTVG